MLGGGKAPKDVKFGSTKSNLKGKKKYNQHEKDLAEKLGGVRQPASGALAHRKGDVVVDDGIFSANKYLFDSKQTEGASILVLGKDITKICREASDEQKMPGLLLTIENLPNTVPKEWAAIPLEVFSELLDRVRKYEKPEDHHGTS